MWHSVAGWGLKGGNGSQLGSLGPPGAPFKMPGNAHRLKQALPPSRLLHILVVTLVMQFHTAAEQQRQKASIRRL